MRFEELYGRYRDGTATEEERAQVEEELAKFRLLADCASEGDELDLPPAPEEAGAGEFRKVKRRLRRRAAGLVLTAVVLACAAVFGGGALWREAVVPFLNEHVYYDPVDKRAYHEAFELSVEFTVLTSLHRADSTAQMVTAENTGLGTYDLTIQERNHLTGEQTYTAAAVDKGRFTFQPDFLRSWNTTNQFTRGTAPFDTFHPGKGPAEMEEKLSGLPDFMELCMAFSFGRDLSMEELAALMERHPELNFYWVGVRNSAPERQYLPLVGFDSNEYILWEDEELLEQYPYLMLYPHDGEPNRGGVYEERFKDMLRYQIDHGELMDMIWSGTPFVREGYYRDVLDYVSENGVVTYGAYVSGRPADLAGLCREADVEQAALEYARLSPDLEGWT